MIDLKTNYKNVLISPLNWGLGHASRCVPIINYFLEQESKVCIFGSKEIIAFLKIRFPKINYIEDKRGEFSYGKRLSATKLLKLTLKIIKQTKSEFKDCKKLCKKANYDLIISDNRYGFYSKKIKSILITHQLEPILPWFFTFTRSFVYKKLKLIYSKFSEVWIPDFQAFPSLSGKLSHIKNMPKNAIFIGVLSRFESFEKKTKDFESQNKFISLITSGPKKHRIKMVNNFLKRTKYNDDIIYIFGVEKQISKDKIHFLENASDEEMYKILKESKQIISGAGYSTIMDLYTIEKKAILQPTKGQTEQKYLAKLYKKANS